MNPWILGSFNRDFLWLHFPGLLGLLFVFLGREFDADSVRLLIVTLIIAWIDNGHVYTTVFRTGLNPRDADRSWKILWVLLAVFLGLALWAELRIPGFWSMVLYVTIFHNARQLWGLHKWYGKLSGRGTERWQDLIFTAMTLGPVLIHFVSPFRSSDLMYVVPGDLWHWPSETAYWSLLGLYGIAWLVFLARTLPKFRSWSQSPVRLWGLLTPGLIYGGAFLFGETADEILVPLVLSHGVAYLALMAQTSDRLKLSAWTGFRPLLLGLFIFAAVFGSLEAVSQDLRESLEPDWLWALLLTPLFTHYVLDAILWRRGHPEAKLVFAASPIESSTGGRNEK